MSWTGRRYARWARGGSIPSAWASISPSSGPPSTSVASTTAGISLSRAAAYGRRRSEARSTRIASCPTSAFTRRSACLPGPAIGVAGGDLSHHLGERVVQVDPLRVGEADDDEQDVGELHRDRALRLLGLLCFLAEPVVHFPRQLTDFFREPREIGQRREVSFFILADPPIDRLLGFAQGHGRLRAIVDAELPPLVAPFRGERYAAKQLSALIAPPYDVISSEDRTRYAARDPHNIVHLMLPEAPSGGGRSGGGDRYAQAATLLATWREAGVVQPDPGESVYVVAQDYTVPSGERRTRIGMLAAVRAEPFEARRVRPHEQTHSAPKADRLALLRATAANLETIFLLAPDPDRMLAQALAKRASGVPAARAQLDGVGIRLWIVSGDAAAELARLAGRAQLYRSEEHTSELQSRLHLVCRLLLEKKKKHRTATHFIDA